MNIMITGHRPKYLNNNYDFYSQPYIQLGWEIRKFILNKIEKINEEEVLNLITGMALGVDIIFALVGIKLKKEFKNVRLNCYIPCLNQEKTWSEEHRELYNKILKEADKIVYVSNQEYNSKLNQMNKRNWAMVDKCLTHEKKFCLAIFNGDYSTGTGNTISYLKNRKVDLEIINPIKYFKK